MLGCWDAEDAGMLAYRDTGSRKSVFVIYPWVQEVGVSDLYGQRRAGPLAAKIPIKCLSTHLLKI
jgi:hypothetical protein